MKNYIMEVIMKKLSSLIIVGTILLSSIGTFANTMTLSEKALDPDISINAEATVTDTVSVYKANIFDQFLGFFNASSSKYSKAKSSVELIKLPVSQWAVNAKSMARDQNGLPIEIDSIHVKGSLYTKDSNGEYIYKVGNSKTESHSSDVMVEKASGSDSSVSMAKGYHRFEHSGFEMIEHSNYDYK
ncbi:MAG: hypothetical protein K0S30_1879 [Clostridia bacterium]|jgi:hypothetical protein|nr:hypothetical protein [Clostridia bacterium]